MAEEPCDLLVVGGGINGAGIARDAAGRGLSVVLVEQDDLASHTSSASTKLIHGGLRYLEYYELRLVREALRERARLLRLAPHIIWPLRFVMPLPETGRPGWLIRLGLFLYDRLGGRGGLPGSSAVDLSTGPFGAGLKPAVTRGFAYSDAWVEDSRLVVLNALDAAARGAAIRTRTRFLDAVPADGLWTATIEANGLRERVRARAIANAAGPWVDAVLGRVGDAAPERPPRLVKGSHIVVPRLFEGDHAYILQNPDRRIVFAIPYEGSFTLVGTTDVPWRGPPDRPAIDAEETAYLCDSVNRYLSRPIGPADVVHSYAGVRPLFDDGRADAASVTRDYVLKIGHERPALLSVFGGKITTYRRLAEHALEKLAPHLPAMGAPWTGNVPLPGGDFDRFDGFLGEVRERWPFLPPALARRLARAYGTRIADLLGDAAALADLGTGFGAGLHAREVEWLAGTEWARTAEDILWRRSKLGLHLPADAAARIDAYLRSRA